MTEQNLCPMALRSRPRRMWINQPSIQQPLHYMHGKKVLAVQEAGGDWTIYFLSGELVSMTVLPECLSHGWPELD